MRGRAFVTVISAVVWIAAGCRSSQLSVAGEDGLPLVASESVAASLNAFADDVERFAAQQPPVLANLCARGVSAANTIEHYARLREMLVDQRYVDYLNADMNLVTEGLTTPRVEDAVQLVSYGVEGLEIKASFAKASPRQWSRLVKVLAHTRKGRDPVSGLQVWYCARGGNYLRHHYWRTFKKRSTPAVDRIPPGVYNIAVEGQDAVVFEVGNHGEQEQALTLYVQPEKKP